MDDTAYIKQRMNSLLNDRIDHGAGLQGGARKRQRYANSRCTKYKKSNPKYWKTAKGNCMDYETHLRRYRKSKGMGEGEGYGNKKGALKGWRTRRKNMGCGMNCQYCMGNGCYCCSGQGVLLEGFDYASPYGNGGARRRKRTIKSRRGGALHNPWIQFLAQFRRMHKHKLDGLPQSEVVKMASQAYHNRRY